MKKLAKLCAIVLFIMLILSVFYDTERLTLRDNYDLSGVTQLLRLNSMENESIVRVYKTIKSRYPDKLIQMVDVEGYNDNIRVMVVMDIAERCVDEVKILSHNETSGNGDKITYNKFLKQFDRYEYDKAIEVSTAPFCLRNEVEAAANATISSRAVVKAVNECIDNFNRNN